MKCLWHSVQGSWVCRDWGFQEYFLEEVTAMMGWEQWTLSRPRVGRDGGTQMPKSSRQYLSQAQPQLVPLLSAVEFQRVTLPGTPSRLDIFFF